MVATTKNPATRSHLRVVPSATAQPPIAVSIEDATRTLVALLRGIGGIDKPLAHRQPVGQTIDSLLWTMELDCPQWIREGAYGTAKHPNDEVSLGEVVGAVVARMRREGVTNPLAQPVTMAALVADLYEAAGVPVPASVARLIG